MYFQTETGWFCQFLEQVREETGISETTLVR
jgi:hypothetical protein